ncbi:MAG: hypothetical protein QXE84_02260 [Candidatus Nitrosotenuis sp.]|uniref:Cupin 2 conserved barrel domain-containing protein n=1 Tax=Candidatus Nitrosotenuis uzonensis TaxID=1407055 RepID=A0A812F437_9ARCH|nr:hypothetical protein [Candidatus Nitrosotenuis uzonensis]CAE6500192.1 conserved hypothetical protein [Candidatus Nitrosotenuis uzonensis]
MELIYEKESADARGKILFLSYGQKRINIVEIKKGFSRGGHYHDFDTVHYILSGTIEYREKDMMTAKEQVRTVTAPDIIRIPAMAAHLLTAIDDTIFAEEMSQNYAATEYPEYRKIVTEKMT